MAERTRRDIWSLDQGRLSHPTTHAYALAVAEMLKRPRTDPTGWDYQAAVHSLARGGDKWTNQCQHQTWFFLPWHRMYLYWFERIVRSIVLQLKSVDDKTKREWALPYWGYGKGAASDALPPAFLVPKLPDGADNPLLVGERGAARNRGVPLPSRSTSSAEALNEPTFSQRALPGLPVGFGGARTAWNHFTDDPDAAPGQLEITPHGSVHTDVGGRGGFMSAFDTAPLDPIFWLHHANIDRLWVVWLARSDRSNPTSARRLNEQFQFHDESGANQSMTPKDVLHTSRQLGYEYDDVTIPAGFAPVAMPVEPPPNPPELVGATNEEVRLTGRLERVSFGLSRPAGPAGAFAERAVSGPSHVYLNLEDVRGEENPGVSYGVFLNMPDDEMDFSNAHYVGNLPFFGIEKARDTNRDHAGGHGGLRYAFDITDLYNRLQTEHVWNQEQVSVSIAPLQDTVADEAFEQEETEHPPITIGRISLFYQ
jgi:tyrosinase